MFDFSVRRSTQHFKSLGVFLFVAISAISTVYFAQYVSRNPSLEFSKAATTPSCISFMGTCRKVLQLFNQRSNKDTTQDTISPNKIFHASGITIDKVRNHIYVHDTGNNRIMGYRTFQINLSQNSLGTPNPDRIFGQGDYGYINSCNFDNNVGTYLSPSDRTLCLSNFPDNTNIAENWMRTNFDVDKDGNLYVVDVYNNRVLRYNYPFSTDTSGGKGDSVADFVIGQPNLFSNGANKGKGITYRDATTLFVGFGQASQGFDHVASRGVSVDSSGNVWIADTFNRRMLRFQQNSQTANLVLGQKDMSSAVGTGCVGNAPLNTMCTPTLARVDPATGYLYVIDEWPAAFHSRILVFRPPFTNGMSAYKSIQVQEGPADRLGGSYFMQTTGFTFNTYKQGEYATGKLWVSEHETRRVVLIDDNGAIIKVVGAVDTRTSGCQYTHYNQCYGNNSIFTDFNLCWAGGSPAFDAQNNMYLPDEAFHRVAIFKLPYEKVTSNGYSCLPKPVGGLYPGTMANSVTALGVQSGVGLASFQNQLIIKDKGRLMAWNQYPTKLTGTKADFVIGQRLPTVRENSLHQLGDRAFHAIDDQNRLWTINQHKQLMIYQLPLQSTSFPIANSRKLYWIDEPTTEVVYEGSGGIAFDPLQKAIWITDAKNNRLLRIKNYNDFSNKLYVDMVLGQSGKQGGNCNLTQTWWSWTAEVPPTAQSLCGPYAMKFDNFGNLFVVEGNYECHGNDRIVMYGAEDLRVASGTLFPFLAARKVFVSNTFTQLPLCNDLNGPRAPVSLAFTKWNSLLVGNDGYYTTDLQKRPYRQLWYYSNPLKRDSQGNYIQGQKPDGYVSLPMGAAGDVIAEPNGNLVVQDHTWNRTWVINLDQDPDWLVNSCGGNGYCENGSTCRNGQCVVGGTPIVNPENCTNTLDDDGDHLEDCRDSDCAGKPLCKDHLIGYWRFDESGGTSVSDGSGSNLTGTTNASWTKGISGNALDFDGVADDKVSIPGYVYAHPGELTVMAWVRPRTPPSGKGRVIIGTYKYAATNPPGTKGWHLGNAFGSQDMISFHVFGSQGHRDYVIYNGFFNKYLAKWTHVAAVYKPSTSMQMYVNGVMVGETKARVPADIGVGSPLRIGMRADNNTQGQWDGQIDEVRVYNRALTPAEIQTEYKRFSPPVQGIPAPTL
ncbi:hypothetical protein HY468_03490 [Candidatus Roizmanbacteria bacterium]|nr:hypothetical protein [Candidatus Roizmanbacteria bacterium]